MNRLEIVKMLAKEAGISSTGPSTTLNQTGEFGRCVDWADRAYQTVQNAHRGRWQFLRDDVTLNITTTAGTTYSRALLKTWLNRTPMVYNTETGITDASDICELPYDEFNLLFLRGSATLDTGRPIHFAVKPDKSMVFYPTADEPYTFKSEYYKQADTLDTDTDEPLFPEDFHMIIVWRALIDYGADYVEPDKYETAQVEYSRVMRELELDQLEPLGFGGPLA